MPQLPAPTEDDRIAAVLPHLLVVLVPLLGAAVVWLLFKDRSPFVRYHAIQAMIGQGGALVVGFVLSVFTCGVGAPLAGLIGLLVALFELYLGYRAWCGEVDGYPGVQEIGG